MTAQVVGASRGLEQGLPLGDIGLQPPATLGCLGKPRERNGATIPIVGGEQNGNGVRKLATHQLVDRRLSASCLVGARNAIAVTLTALTTLARLTALTTLARLTALATLARLTALATLARLTTLTTLARLTTLTTLARLTTLTTLARLTALTTLARLTALATLARLTAASPFSGSELGICHLEQLSRGLRNRVARQIIAAAYEFLAVSTTLAATATATATTTTTTPLAGLLLFFRFLFVARAKDGFVVVFFGGKELVGSRGKFCTTTIVLVANDHRFRCRLSRSGYLRHRRSGLFCPLDVNQYLARGCHGCSQAL
jgi:hypothetical protein